MLPGAASAFKTETVLRAMQPRRSVFVAPTAEIQLTFLLEAYQLRTPQLSEEFEAASRPVLRRMAKKHGIGLPDDVQEEVVQEVFLALANPSLVRFDPARGTVNQYLLGRVLNAVKTVQVSQGLRRTGSDFESEPQREFVTVDGLEFPASGGIQLGAMHARELVKRMFSGLGAELQQACFRVWADEEPQARVALDLGMSRFALARKLAGVKAMCAPYAALA
jgi:hypothetical protein